MFKYYEKQMVHFELKSIKIRRTLLKKEDDIHSVVPSPFYNEVYKFSIKKLVFQRKLHSIHVSTTEAALLRPGGECGE